MPGAASWARADTGAPLGLKRLTAFARGKQQLERDRRVPSRFEDHTPVAQVVDPELEVLRAFAGEPGPVAVSELERRSGLSEPELIELLRLGDERLVEEVHGAAPPALVPTARGHTILRAILDVREDR